MKIKPVFIRIRIWQSVLLIVFGIAGILSASSTTFHHPLKPSHFQEIQTVPIGQHFSYRRVSHSDFKKWIDSVRNDSSASALLDSLLRTRPGLRDSILSAEDYSQLTNILKK